MKKKYKFMTEEEFNRIKPLTNPELKMTNKQLAAVTSRSANILDMVKKSSTFLDYKSLTFANAEKRGKVAKPKKPEAASYIPKSWGDEPTAANDPTIRPSIVMITTGFLPDGVGMKIFGLGTDNEVYYYTSTGWQRFNKLYN